MESVGKAEGVKVGAKTLQFVVEKPVEDISEGVVFDVIVREGSETWDMKRRARDLPMLHRRLTELGVRLPRPPKVSRASPDVPKKIEDWLRAACHQAASIGEYTPLEAFFGTRLDIEVHRKHVSMDKPVDIVVRRYRHLTGNCEGKVLLLHGYADSALRDRFIEDTHQLCKRGFSVYAFDQPNFGYSSGLKGYVHSADVHVESCSYVADWAQKHGEEELPFFILGHSMGGALALHVGQRRKSAGNPVSGVILNSPMLAVSETQSPLMQKVAGIMSLIAPRMRIVGLDRTTICHDPYYSDLFMFDPRNYTGKIYNRTASELLRLCKVTEETIPSVSVPFYALHGTGDLVTDHAKTRQLFDMAQTPDHLKELKLFEGLYHVLGDEPDMHDEVYCSMAKWMERVAESQGHKK